MQLDTSRLWSLFILVVSQFVYEATFSLLLSGSRVRAHALRTGSLSSKPVTACSTTLGKVVTSHRVQNVLLKGDMQTASNHSGSVYDFFSYLYGGTKAIHSRNHTLRFEFGSLPRLERCSVFPTNTEEQQRASAAHSLWSHGEKAYTLYADVPRLQSAGLMCPGVGCECNHSI